MTHAQALEGNHLGLVPSVCAGELRSIDQHADEVIEHAGEPLAKRLVTIYRCEACGMHLSIAQAASGTLRLLNQYPPNPCGETAEHLARAFSPPL